jgi:hypothetical protein
VESDAHPRVARRPSAQMTVDRAVTYLLCLAAIYPVATGRATEATATTLAAAFAGLHAARRHWRR